jgi:hypothetical protein
MPTHDAQMLGFDGFATRKPKKPLSPYLFFSQEVSKHYQNFKHLLTLLFEISLEKRPSKSIHVGTPKEYSKKLRLAGTTYLKRKNSGTMFFLAMIRTDLIYSTKI